jgi:Effector-associated domain 10
MSTSDELKNIVEKLLAEVKIDEAIDVLRQAHECGEKITLQVGDSIVNIGQGKDFHIGDRTYIVWNDEATKALIEFFQKLQSTTQTPTPQLASVDELVQQVRSNLHDDIQRLHGTMPLWGVDRWVPLGDLFVDVNILEELI